MASITWSWYKATNVANENCAVKISSNCPSSGEKIVLGLRKTLGPDKSECFQELDGKS